jgi:wobble nucleotide-excising tRNase
MTYNGQPIPQDQITKVFSESDRRNLALSVFMSRAEKLDKKSEKILVLDDPVVSFDDNRIPLTCRELKIASNDFAQMIITTHYISLIKESIDCSMPAQYIEIESINKKSSMKVLDAAKLTLPPHERDCDRICLFIDGSNDYGVFSNLRPFMEQHLRIRYQQQITNGGYDELKLGELITKLKDEGLISEGASVQLHGFRESLNPDHHAAIGDENIEEARLEAKDLLNLLYSDLGSV